jgi:hypothetical protein
VIHRDVGGAHQHDQRLPVFGRQCDADRRADNDLLVADLKRLGQRRKHQRPDPRRILAPVDMRKEHREFVTGIASDDGFGSAIGLPHHFARGNRPQPVGDLD